jgi:hypothetical protein
MSYLSSCLRLWPFVFLLGLTACGGSSSRQSVSIIAISISPGSTNLLQGGTQTFTATVTGSSNVGVNWTVQEGPGGGTITNAGVYTAPSANGTFHVVATSQADTSRSATAIVTVAASVGIVVLPPTSLFLDQGGTHTFVALVSGSNNSGVTWTVQEGTAGGSITNSGVYTAPNAAGTFHVVATSQADTSKSATATVTVSAVGIFLDPTSVSMGIGESQTFTFGVFGTVNRAVTFSISEGAAGGAVTNSGIYTAPATFGTFHVVVTSVAANTVSATATVTVEAVSVSIFPSSDTLGPFGGRLFAATVKGSVNHTVTWSLQAGSGGIITPLGQYTAPNATGTATVVATSVKDPSKSATATVSLVASGFRLTGNMRSGRTGHTATVLKDGKVLVAAGDGCFFDQYYGDCPLNSAELYDPVLGAFSTTGSVLLRRVFHTATLLSSGKVLITGGGVTSGTSAELYDPVAGTFAATGSMTAGRQFHTATLLPNGKVLLTGGNNAVGDLDTAELYDPATGAFTATGKMAFKRSFHTATLLGNGKVLVAGGSSGTAVTSSAELFDPATGIFTATGSMGKARLSHTATLLTNGNVLVAGGQGVDFVLATAELYDAGTGSFSATGSMLQSRASHVAALLPNGTVLVAGGSSDEAFNPAKMPAGFTAEIFNPATASFIQTGGLQVEHAIAAVVVLTDGRVLVTGGSDTIVAELYK